MNGLKIAIFIQKLLFPCTTCSMETVQLFNSYGFCLACHMDIIVKQTCECVGHLGQLQHCIVGDAECEETELCWVPGFRRGW